MWVYFCSNENYEHITTYHYQYLSSEMWCARLLWWLFWLQSLIQPPYIRSQKVSFAVEFMKNHDIVTHHLQILLILCSESSTWFARLLWWQFFCYSPWLSLLHLRSQMRRRVCNSHLRSGCCHRSGCRGNVMAGGHDGSDGDGNFFVDEREMDFSLAGFIEICKVSILVLNNRTLW